METLKQRFENATINHAPPKHLIVAVRLPTGAIEIIHNTEQTASKVEYYLEKYDDELRLKANSEVQIINFMII